MDINIRKATPDDAYDYAACHISCFQTAYKGIVPDSYLENMTAEKEKRVEQYSKALAEPGDCQYWCVIYEERMVGFLITHSSGEIWAVYLIEEFRGLGFGKQMLDFAIGEQRRINSGEIFLWVFEENIRARRFYEKNNLSVDGTKREMKYGKPLVQLRYAFASKPRRGLL